MQAGNESDAVSIASSQNNVMPSRHVTCGLIEAMVDGELRYIIGGRSNGGMGGLTGELPARRVSLHQGASETESVVDGPPIVDIPFSSHYMFTGDCARNRGLVQ